MVLKKIGILSIGKIAACIYGAMGLIFGAILSLVSIVGAGIGAASGEQEAFFGALFGVGAIIVLPIFYGLIGAIAAMIGSAIYNLAASVVGGIEIELE